MLHTIVEGEPGIFPDPVARVMRRIGGWFERRRPAEPAGAGDPTVAGEPSGAGRPDSAGRPGGTDEPGDAAAPPAEPKV